jgi:GGDEF domain-containing protein
MALLVVWLLFFYGIEWLTPEVKFALAADLLVPLAALVFLLVPRLQTTNVAAVLGLLLGLLLALKWATDSPIGGRALPMTLSETCFLFVAVLLARWASRDITRLEQAVVSLSVGRHGERRDRKAEIYREIRRARLHQRPLAILTLRPAPGTATRMPDRIQRQATQALAHHYLLAAVSRAVCGVFDEDQIVAKQDDHYLIVLPETTPEAVPEAVRRLRQAVQEQIGIHLQVGAAALPGDATTLEGLLDQATRAMLAAPAGSASSPAAPRAERLSAPESSHGPGHC